MEEEIIESVHIRTANEDALHCPELFGSGLFLCGAPGIDYSKKKKGDVENDRKNRTVKYG